MGVTTSSLDKVLSRDDLVFKLNLNGNLNFNWVNYFITSMQIAIVKWDCTKQWLSTKLYSLWKYLLIFYCKHFAVVKWCSMVIILKWQLDQGGWSHRRLSTSFLMLETPKLVFQAIKKISNFVNIFGILYTEIGVCYTRGQSYKS